MKKFVIFILIAALVAGMAFAQEESNWKVGFMAQNTMGLLWATKMTAKAEQKTGSQTDKVEFGKYNKGSLDIFNTEGAGGGGYLPTPDNRLLLNVSNKGDNYEVYADIALDQWDKNFSGIWAFLGSGFADWYVKGNLGIFNAQLGSAGYGGWVNAFGTWNDFLGWNTLSRFGVMKPGWGFVCSDDFRTFPEWGNIFAVGASFTDSVRFSIGHRFNPGWWDSIPSHNNPAASASSVNASAMLNIGGIADILNIDVFYGINGHDENTAVRGTDGKWENVLGAYIGISAIENLGLSVGYTANFNVHEKDTYTDVSSEKPRSIKDPLYSGVDLHVSFSGIDNIGLTFNNRVNFAGAKGEEAKVNAGGQDISDKFIMGFSGNRLEKDDSQNWFGWESELKAGINGLVDDMGLTVHLANRLGVTTTKSKPSGNDYTVKLTDNEFRLSVTAQYAIGNVTLTPGIFFQIDGAIEKIDGKDYSYNGSYTTLSFGIPLLFKVAF